MEEENKRGSLTTVVNIRQEKYDVKICRKPDNSIPPAPETGCFGNPFFLKDVNNDVERAECVAQYKDYFYEKIKDPVFLNAVLQLKGKKLGCFCAPKQCHGDIIKEFLDGR